MQRQKEHCVRHSPFFHIVFYFISSLKPLLFIFFLSLISRPLYSFFFDYMMIIKIERKY